MTMICGPSQDVTDDDGANDIHNKRADWESVMVREVGGKMSDEITGRRSDCATHHH